MLPSTPMVFNTMDNLKAASECSTQCWAAAWATVTAVQAVQVVAVIGRQHSLGPTPSASLSNITIHHHQLPFWSSSNALHCSFTCGT